LRKYLAIVISLVFVLGIAALAYAEEPQIKLGGQILIRGWLFDNVSNLGTAPVPADSKTASFYTTNAKIILDAKVSDNVQGFMELETAVGDSTGASTQVNKNTGLYVWGAGDDTKPNSALLFRQLWLQYSGTGLLGFPVALKAGHMPVTLGEKQFLNNERFGDDAIVLLLNPNKELTIGLLTGKIFEGVTTDAQDDTDAYAALATYKLDKDTTAGANLTLVKNDNLALNLWNLGLHANAKVAGLSLVGELDYQLGGVGDPENKFKGYGIFVKAGYKLDPVNIRASVAMGSGDSDTTGDYKEFQTLQGPDAIGPLARFVHYTQIYARTIRTASGSQVLGNTRNTGIANTTYLNVGADVTPAADLSLSVDAFLLSATKTAGGRDKAVGTEVDLKGTYKLAKNLNYFVEAGMFMPGDYYTTGTTKLGTDDTVTQVVHGLNLTF
jgi:hypothetical protein